MGEVLCSCGNEVVPEDGGYTAFPLCADCTEAWNRGADSAGSPNGERERWAAKHEAERAEEMERFKRHGGVPPEAP